MAALRDILALREGGVLSIVGAGGKTTLMFRLAAEIASSGERVLTTTTTKIFMPQPEQSSNVIVASNPDEIKARAEDLFTKGFVHLTAAKSHINGGKLQGFDAPVIDKLRESGLFQWILVEADGAARRPLKAPAAHEPVIPLSSRWVVAMVGLDALGQPLSEEWVFRSRFYAGLTGLSPGETITEESVAAVLIHEAGMMKGAPGRACKYVFLNKAETEKRRASGRKIARLLQECRGLKIDKVVIGSLETGNSRWECYDLFLEATAEEAGCS